MMPQKHRLACAIGLLLLTSGCQSYSTFPPPVVVQYLPIPQPNVWFMAEREPNLTQRMLNELSGS
ncbi:hypothetical protein AB9V60_08925 [Pseudomonas syringae pv. atrofaciens]|uniref:hypothetical protein n=1 Tax=Pseudomonas syringae TaxID=317 RepID=UPI00267D9A46